MNEFLTFILTEERRSNFMTSMSRIRLFSKKHNINKGCYDGFRVYPRKITERIIPLYRYKNHFCSF